MTIEAQLARLQEMWRNLQNTPRVKLYNVARGHLGTDVTPKDHIPDTVACAEVLTTLVQKVNPKQVIIPSTAAYATHMATRTDVYTRVSVPLPGDILIYPTGTGNGKIRGHVFIKGVGNVLMSNNSLTGLFDTHFTIESARRRYEQFGGMKPQWFRLI